MQKGAIHLPCLSNTCQEDAKNHQFLKVNGAEAASQQGHFEVLGHLQEATISRLEPIENYIVVQNLHSTTKEMQMLNFYLTFIRPFFSCTKLNRHN